MFLNHVPCSNTSDNSRNSAIPAATLAHTTLTALAVGQRVNLEADVLARYVARQLELAGLTADPAAEGRLRSPEAARRPSPRGAPPRRREATRGKPRAAQRRAASADDGAGHEEPTADARLLEQLREGGFLE